MGGAGLVAGAGIGGAVVSAVANRPKVPALHAFYGEHQSGITTEVQEHLHFASFDVGERTTRDELIELLQDWTYAASRMTQGLEVSASGAVGGSPQAPPDDTGEALGLAASALTITFGFGPSLFDRDGVDRFGIKANMPDGFERLPAFLGEDLDPLLSDGDLCIQACADDPQVAVHAIRNLSRIAFGRATLRWSQLGFGRTSKTTADQSTPRNLFGYKDGTANILADDTKALDDHVWVHGGPAWLVGGTYLVARKIAMTIETWDRVRLAEQDRIMGRDKGEGAPLSGGSEMTVPDFAAKRDGNLALDEDSHVRRAHPDLNNGVRILRRGYNYVDGNSSTGALSAGLFFLSFQHSPERFTTIQRALARESMAEYIKHIASGLWAIPPGAPDGGYVGEGLFAS